jgi:hypothetical protein
MGWDWSLGSWCLGLADGFGLGCLHLGSGHVRLVCILAMALLLDSQEAAPYGAESTMLFLNFLREVVAMFSLL